MRLIPLQVKEIRNPSQWFTSSIVRQHYAFLDALTETLNQIETIRHDIQSRLQQFNAASRALWMDWGLERHSATTTVTESGDDWAAFILF